LLKVEDWIGNSVDRNTYYKYYKPDLVRHFIILNIEWGTASLTNSRITCSNITRKPNNWIVSNINLQSS